MSTTIADLDKSLASELDDDYGSIVVRVVVLDKASAPVVAEDAVPEDADADEVLPEGDTKRPVDSYLESPKRGKFCCVFLVNGQRQHAWDNTFIVRDLELKYLRNRMLVIVTVDGLKPQALAMLMQGSRHQFYEGTVYDALHRRVVATLKGDPDLVRLEAEAEQEVSSLKAGDEVVRAALDQLIESHHDSAARTVHGHLQSGSEARDDQAFGDLKQTRDLVIEGTTGQAADGPVLIATPEVPTVRLKPNEAKQLLFRAKPSADWAKLERFSLDVQPPVAELQVKHLTQVDSATAEVVFNAPDDFDEDEYPVQTTIKALALFTGHPEPRICERHVIVNRPRTPPPPKPPRPLLDEPTFLQVTSRQPVRMTIGGPDLHVKLKWDGKDSLASGDPPNWRFSAECTSGQQVGALTFTRPHYGKFELLVRVPEGIGIGEKLQFHVEAAGGGKALSTSFEVEAIEPLSARRITEQIAGGAQRRPPYELRYVSRDSFTSATCWGGDEWTGDDPGAFQPPSQGQALTLFINQDYGLLESYREGLTGRRLAEQTIQQRVTKYTSHVAYHLWQMYNYTQDRMKASLSDSSIHAPDEEEERAEIQRVASTLIRLMDQ